MRTIQTFINNGEKAQALDYIQTFTEESNIFDEQRYCENFPINALLNYYINWAQEEGVTCTIGARCGGISIASSGI